MLSIMGTLVVLTPTAPPIALGTTSSIAASYAFAPAPCSTAVAIKLILLKVLSTYPVQSYQVKIKNDNEMALFVNQYYFGFVVTGRDDNYTYMQAQLN